jgi:hypothetical protein
MKSVAIALATALSVLVAVSVGVISYLMGGRHDSTAAAPSNVVVQSTAAATPSAVPASSSQPASKPATPRPSTKTVFVTPKTHTPARVTLSSLGSKPCTTLFNRGVGYERMFVYYEEFGYPDSMDVDGDGYPCETVYGNLN